jgi:hypothetical protein
MKSNECHEYRESIAALVLGELPQDQVPAIEQHLEACPTCSELYQALQQEEQVLRSTFQAIVDRTEARKEPLVQSLAEQASTDNPTTPNILAIVRYIMSSKLTRLAVAAIVVLGCLIGLQYFTGSMDPAGVAWADVQEAFLARPWVHLSYDNGSEDWHNLVEGKRYYKDWDGRCVYIDKVLNIRRSYFPNPGTYIRENRPRVYKDGVIPPWEPKTVWDTIVGHVEVLSENGAEQNTQRQWEAERHIEKTGKKTLIRFDTFYMDGAGRRLLITQLWADPRTRLPVKKWERLELAERDEQDRDFITGTFAFPASGPSSLQDLGVPQNLPIDKTYDKVPDASVLDIIDRVKAAQARFPKHYRAQRWGNTPGDNMGLVWRSDQKIHSHTYSNMNADMYPDHHLDLPAAEETVFQWAQTQEPAVINLFDGERQYTWRRPHCMNKTKPPEVRVMRVSSDYLMGSSSKPIENQWPLDIRTPSRYAIIKDTPRELASYVGLRSERGDTREELYLDPEHDYICVRQIWWKLRSGHWEKQRDFDDVAFERLPEGQWYVSQRGDNWNLRVTVLQEDEFPPDIFNGEKLLEGAVIETY